MSNDYKLLSNSKEEIYGILAKCLLEPLDIDTFLFVTNELGKANYLPLVNEQIVSGLEGLKNLDLLEENLPISEKVLQTKIDYTALFIGPSIPLAPPWESLYRTKHRVLFGETSFQTRRLLNKYGIELARKNQIPEDHIGIQLLFLSVLNSSEVINKKESSIEFIEDQISFIDEHLLSWIQEFYNNVRNFEQTGFYGNILEIVWGVLLWDRELLNELKRDMELI